MPDLHRTPRRPSPRIRASSGALPPLGGRQHGSAPLRPLDLSVLVLQLELGRDRRQVRQAAGHISTARENAARRRKW